MNKRVWAIVAAALLGGGLLVALAVTCVGWHLRRVYSPRSVDLEISGESGRRIAGTVQEDGVTRRVSEILPAKIECRGIQISYALALVRVDPQERITVQTYIDGRAFAKCSAWGVEGGVYASEGLIRGGSRGIPSDRAPPMPGWEEIESQATWHDEDVTDEVELRGLQGDWLPITMRLGDLQPSLSGERERLIIKDKSFVAVFPLMVANGVFRLDASTNPPTFDAVVLNDRGEHAYKYLGIYQLSENELRLAYDYAWNDRPSDFTGGSESRTLVELRRKPTADEPTVREPH